MKSTWYQVMRLSFQIGYSLLIVFALIGRSFGTAAVLMGAALLGGAWFCGWLCPLGTAQEWIGRLGKFIFRKRLRVPVKAERVIKYTRYVLLALGLAGFGFAAVLNGPYYSFTGLITGNMSYITVFAWSFLGLFLAASLIIDRPFCRYLCTEGARYGALSLGRIFSIKRNKDTCIQCGKCDRTCPMQVRVSKRCHVRDPQCINCFECTAVCPVPNTLKYGFVFSKSWKKNKEISNEFA